jgi:protein MpaA
VKWGKVPTLLDAVDALGFDELGRSSEGRPIRGHRFGASGGDGLLVMGGIHGDEPASVEAVTALAARMLARSGQSPSGAPGWPGPVWVLPVANPDGIARGSKNSARDVDLNRNFPARSFTTDHRPGYFPGPAPLSEPETQLIAALIARERVTAVVAVHAPFACVNYDGPAAAWAEAVAAACGWPAQADIGYPTPGSLGSWLGVDRGLPVLTLELPDRQLGAHAGGAAAALDEAVRAVPVYTA